MTERQLECFLSLAKVLNFNRAAQQLYLSQPALSQQIRALENDLGVQLFTRTNHSVALTPAGLVFYRDAADYLAYSREVVQRVRHSTEQYTILREVSYMMFLQRMPEILQAFHARQPHIMVRLHQADSINQSQTLFFKRNDIGIAFGDPETDYGTHCFTPLYSGNFICILPEHHPLAQKPFLQVEDLAGEQLFTITEQMSNPMLHHLNAFLTEKRGVAGVSIISNFHEAITMAGAGFGVAIVPQLIRTATFGTVQVPFDYPEQYHIGLFTAKNAPEDVQLFCSLAKELCRPEDTVTVQL